MAWWVAEPKTVSQFYGLRGKVRECNATGQQPTRRKAAPLMLTERSLLEMDWQRSSAAGGWWWQWHRTTQPGAWRGWRRQQQEAAAACFLWCRLRVSGGIVSQAQAGQKVSLRV